MSSKTSTSSNAHNQQKKEFQVRIPKTTNKRLTILKFNESLNVRPQRWTLETLRMEREDNRRAGLTTAGGFVQDFGEGSEYGKAAREEARLKKFGRQARKYEHDKQPWRLTIEQQVTGDAESGTSKSTKIRKFRSMREAGASEHADYWVFYKSGNDLEAHKVDEWYQFLPAVTYKYLDAEQAEERFKERDKVLNQFALKAQIKKQLAEQEDQLQQQQRQKIGDTMKRTGALKIKDEVSSDEDGEGDDEGEQNEKSKNGKKKKDGKKGKKAKSEKDEKKTKKQRVKAADEIADYESSDGQDEGREYDYMSDSGSDSEREQLNVDQKMDDDLVGVADEQGLKHDLDSDEDDDDFGDDEDDENEDEEEKNEQEEIKKNGVKEQNSETVESRSRAVKNVDKMMEQNSGTKIRADIDAADDSDDSDFDEDPDSSKVNSVLFMQDKRKLNPPVSSSQQRKRQEPGGSSESQPSSSISEQPETKRAKMFYIFQ